MPRHEAMARGQRLPSGYPVPGRFYTHATPGGKLEGLAFGRVRPGVVIYRVITSSETQYPTRHAQAVNHVLQTW